jgi:hypothetical protein
MPSTLAAPLLTAALLASVVLPAHAAKDDLLFVGRASDAGGAAGDAGAGNDQIDGRTGRDQLRGGPGRDAERQ